MNKRRVNLFVDIESVRIKWKSQCSTFYRISSIKFKNARCDSYSVVTQDKNRFTDRDAVGCNYNFMAFLWRDNSV